MRSSNIGDGIYKNYIKRPMDFILALISILILSPVMLTIVLLVRTKLGSPVLFKQRRVGRNEKIFTIYKFRTMTEKRDQNGRLLPAMHRVTKFGAGLRRSSLDELPELFNILLGQMSIVGPRPLLVKYLPFYNDMEARRHSVLPGLTGLAQINGRNQADWEQRFLMDVQYADNITLLRDIKILMQTVLKVIRREGVLIGGAAEALSFDNYRRRQHEQKLQG